jgi:hypothetical protein
MSKVFYRFHWLLLAVTLYMISHFVGIATDDTRQFSTIFWKLGNATVAAWIGYQIDRDLFRSDTEIDSTTHPLIHIRRAIIVSSCMLAISIGL